MPREQFKDHVIVCGFGIVGERVVEILQQNKVKLVVVEKDAKKIEFLEDREIPVVVGDATSSKTLKDAGIAGARAIAVVMDDDAKNLFTVITAKSLNPKIIIATRANNEFIKSRLESAGASFIATPNISASTELFDEIVKDIG
ncbi:MAG: NAD-binding protein [Candidatus Micrarchaeota archaeon]|nr:NAD-binding protein [Candidatus Micrarchaeota archaeon]MDE1804755.1 NAD-binding protein [Candidatus Micrarchaeota archaeon]MDE1847087.1 NAD-binding protein [Candidatus Micrarchaeota archaeon]